MPSGLPPVEDDLEFVIAHGGEGAGGYGGGDYANLPSPPEKVLASSPSDLDLSLTWTDQLGEGLEEPQGPAAYTEVEVREMLMKAHQAQAEQAEQQAQAPLQGRPSEGFYQGLLSEARVMEPVRRSPTAPMPWYIGPHAEAMLTLGAPPWPPEQGAPGLPPAYARSASMPLKAEPRAPAREPKKEKQSKAKAGNPAPKGPAKSCKGKSASSRFRGVTQHRRTGRWEAHVWVEGKQVYLGGFDDEERAGRAYDLVAIRVRGSRATTNFELEEYAGVIPDLTRMQMGELVQLLRRRSKGFSRGRSQCRGVTKHKCGKWEARLGNKGGGGYHYLGLFEKEADAARAHDRAAVLSSGVAAMTNFDITNYSAELHVHWKNNKRSGEDPGAPHSSFRAASDALHRGLAGRGRDSLV